MSKNIRILIADDHAVVRRGLRAFLDTEPDMEVVGEASDGVEAVDQAIELKPDVILLDMVMPKKNGPDVIADIKGQNPDARILVLTSYAQDHLVFPAIKAGALGYLLKDSSPRDLIQAIRDVHQGASSLHPSIARMLIGELSQPSSLPPTDDPLTSREVEVLKLVAQGLSNEDIAKSLVISDRTVDKHIGNFLEKLHLANRTQAALYALREGLTSLEPE